MDRIAVWCSKNKLTVNTERTGLMWTYSNRNPPDLEPPTIALKTRKTVKSYNYLGVIIDVELSWKKQAAKVVNLMKIRLAQLRQIRPSLDNDLALEIYNIMVLPIMDYSDFLLDGGYLANYEAYITMGYA